MIVLLVNTIISKVFVDTEPRIYFNLYGQVEKLEVRKLYKSKIFWLHS